MPKVSIQVPCFNSGLYISETIKSLLGQTFSDFEAIVINDGSNDDTEKIVKSFNDDRIKYIYQGNKGLAATRNRALTESSGKYIAFLDHDDIWFPEKLEKQVAILDTDKDIALIYSNLYSLLPDGRRALRFRTTKPQGDVFERFLYDYPVCLSTAIIRKSSLDSLDRPVFDEHLKVFEDYDLFMRLLRSTKAAYIKDPLVLYRIHNMRSSIGYADRYADEHKYVIDKLKALDPSFAGKYGCALRYLDATIAHIRAKMAMSGYDIESARKHLDPYKWRGFKFFALYGLTFLPPVFWNKVHDVKNNGVLL